ncbi:MAG: 16S rRNA processing protein RimM [Deltaproteobacteria bacterium]|nr:16S rRNA processing protein RimM [Candidatus Anaeroferrophillacea bacterium]
MSATWQVLGRVVRAHGLCGSVRVVVYGETPASLELPGVNLRLPGGRLVPVEFTERRPVRGGFLYDLHGYRGLDAVAPLIPAEIVIRQEDLPPPEEDEYYHFQLLGLAVEDFDGTPRGTLAEIITTVAHDVYVVRGAGGELLIPAAAPFIVRIDTDCGRMVVDSRSLREAGGEDERGDDAG